MGGVIALLMSTAIHAATPVWTFKPLTATRISVPVTGTATVQYTVTNQSHKSHTLFMKPIQGIQASGCATPLAGHQSCTLTLSISGSKLQGDVSGGPILCEQGNPNQCYQPSRGNSLAIQRTQTPPVQQYSVTSTAGSNGSVIPVGTQTVNSGTTLTFTATPDAGYGVNQWLVDGALAQTGGATYQLTHIAANHTVEVSFGTVTLEASISDLTLSVTGHAEYGIGNPVPQTSGVPRIITISNTGSGDAVNFQVTSTDLPSDTTTTGGTCNGLSTLTHGSSCTIQINPGITASSNSGATSCANGTEPVAGTVRASASNASATTTNVLVLDYGCVYQGGLVFAFDDTTPNTTGVGGKVVTASNASSNIVWDADPACASLPFLCTQQTDAWDIRYGQNLFTVPGSTNPNNTGTNGPGNTYQIFSVLNGKNGNTNIPPNYAAGVCISYAGGSYTDWYLPAICEMGYTGSVGGDAGCGTSDALTLQNIQSNLVAPGGIAGAPSGFYWSSTEDAGSPQFGAWSQYFAASGSGQNNVSKLNQYGVLCVRGF